MNYQESLEIGLRMNISKMKVSGLILISRSKNCSWKKKSNSGDGKKNPAILGGVLKNKKKIQLKIYDKVYDMCIFKEQ